MFQVKKNEQKDLYAPHVSLGSYLSSDSSAIASINTKNLQQYNKFIRPPQLPQTNVFNQNLPTYLPQPMLPQFFCPSSYSPINALDPVKYPFGDPQSIFNAAASVGFPPNKESAMFPPLSGVKGWPLLTFDNMGNPIPIPRMYGKYGVTVMNHY